MYTVVVTGSCSGDTRLLAFDPDKLFSLQAFLSRCLCVRSLGAHPEVQTAQWETATASEVSRQPDQLLHQHPAALLPQRRPRWGTQQSESRLLESRTRLDAVPLTAGRFNLLTKCSQTLMWNWVRYLKALIREVTTVQVQARQHFLPLRCFGIVYPSEIDVTSCKPSL